MTYTSTDASGNTATATQNVTVEDTTPPVVTAPDDVTVEANTTGGATGVDLGDASVSDIADPNPELADDAPGLFPLGNTTVTYTGTDASDNSATSTQNVLVEDTTPPVVTAPADVIVKANTEGGAIGVDLGDATVSDIADADIDVTDDAPDFFPLGTTVVTYAATDDSGNSATSTQNVLVATEGDMSIAKEAGPDPVVAGEQLTYTITVTNNATSTATGIVVTDVLHESVTFERDLSSDGCSRSSGVVTCDVDNLAAGDSATIEIVVTVDPDTANGTSTVTIINTATVSSDQIDTDESNNTSEPSETTVIAEADLSVTKLADPDPVVAGKKLTYTITVVNNGPSDATGVSVVDILPAGTELVLGSIGSCSEDGVSLTCDIGTLEADDTNIITFKVIVDEDTEHGTVIQNSALVLSPDQTDPDPANNLVEVETDVQGLGDVSVTKEADIDEVVAGESLTYTIVVTNNHATSTATGIVVTDTLPDGVALDSASASCTEADGTVTCDVADLEPGASSAPITIVVNVDSSATSTITNIAVVTSDQSDIKPKNNSVSVETDVDTMSDLSIVKDNDVGEEESVVAGQDQIIYTIVVENLGPSDATGIVVTDILPDKIDVDSATGRGTFDEETGVWTVGDLPAASSTTLILVVDVKASAPKGDLTNLAMVTGDQEDPDDGNNSDSANADVITRSDLSILKDDDVGDGDSVLLGEVFKYTIIATNDGPSRATQVIISDSLPDGVDFVSFATTGEDCTETDGNISCDIGNLGVGNSAEVTIKSRSIRLQQRTPLRTPLL